MARQRTRKISICFLKTAGKPSLKYHQFIKIKNGVKIRANESKETLNGELKKVFM